jgi:hypothetical protein
LQHNAVPAKAAPGAKPFESHAAPEAATTTRAPEAARIVNKPVPAAHSAPVTPKPAPKPAAHPAPAPHAKEPANEHRPAN